MSRIHNFFPNEVLAELAEVERELEQSYPRGAQGRDEWFIVTSIIVWLVREVYRMRCRA